MPIETETFSYTGADQTFTVPTGVRTITVDAQGAEGGPERTSLFGFNTPKGKGGRVVCDLDVTPGEILHLRVGGQGGLGNTGVRGAAGYNGGAQGGTGAGGGGGASDVRQGGTDLADRVVVAGGGGGAGANNTDGVHGGGGNGGGGNGSNGADGTSGPLGGHGATTSAGGAGGFGFTQSGAAGALGAGGDGGDEPTSPRGGGGGGGGLYGGGGGGVNPSGTSGGGGGGGAGLGTGVGQTLTSGYRAGDGQVVLTWIEPDEVPRPDNLNATELVWVYDYFGVQTMALDQLFVLELDDRLQASETLRFTIGADDPKADFVLIDTMVRYRRRFYRIKSRDPSRDGTRTTIDVQAEALWIDLADRVIPGPFLVTGDTPDHGLDLIVLHRDYGWVVGTVDAPAFAFYGIDKTDATILELLREWAHNTGCELVFDTDARTVSLLLAQGEARDLGFRYAWNLRGITRRETPPEVTRLYAYGRNGLTIKALSPDGTEHIDDFSYYTAQGLTSEEAEAQYLREKIWKDDAFISDGPLYEAAVARLAALAQPVAAYEAKVIDLTGSGLPVAIGIGDTVPVRDSTLGISIRTRVVRLVTRPLAPHTNEIELAYLQGRPSDSTTSRATSNGDDWLLFLNSNLADRTINANLSILNDIGLQFSGEGQALFHLDAMGVATDAGAVRVQFWDETTNELAGATDDFLFADGEPVHISVAFGLEDLDGQHLFSVRIQVVDGTGSIAFETGSSRFAILAKGALGVSLPPDDNSVTYLFESDGTDDGSQTNGELQTFDVPPDVTSIVIDCYGAAGTGTNAGKGGRVRARVPVVAGETLNVYVGGHSSHPDRGGWNGGGDGDAFYTVEGKGGGGAADVRRGTALADRLIVGGGGGGIGNSGTQQGGDGGYPDGAPGSGPGANGQGGTQSAGGAGGTGGASVYGAHDGQPGTLGDGGNGGSVHGGAGGFGGGGGGGGLYGGGGGASQYGDGGGGSGGAVDPGPLLDGRPGTPTELFVENGVVADVAKVIISWDTP